MPAEGFRVIPMNDSNFRPVITGIGTINPLGSDVRSTWEGLKSGSTAGFRTVEFPNLTTSVAALVDDAALKDALDQFINMQTDRDRQRDLRKDRPRTHRSTQMSLVAIHQAMVQAGIAKPDGTVDVADSFGVGVYMGSGGGGSNYFGEIGRRLLQQKPIPGTDIGRALLDKVTSYPGRIIGARGPWSSSVSACSSANTAMIDAAKTLMNAQLLGTPLDYMITGGVDAIITPELVGPFESLHALAQNMDPADPEKKRKREPGKASRPYDVGREGFVMSEGATAFVMETEAHARQRGAPILAYMDGWGQTADAVHDIEPAESGEAVARALELALGMAQLLPFDPQLEGVYYMNPHATSTPKGDLAEAAAIARVFSPVLLNTIVGATKSMTGHMLGAAGAMEALACIMALREGIIPPSVNLDTLDPEIAKFELRFAGIIAQSFNIIATINNSFGMGGSNTATVFRRGK